MKLGKLAMAVALSLTVTNAFALEAHWYQSGWDSHTHSLKNWVDEGTLSAKNFDQSDYRVLNLTHGQLEQVIDGFGGAFNEKGWDAMYGLSAQDKQQVIDHLFGPDGLKLNMGRVPIGASDYAMDYYSLDDVKGDYALKHFSLKRDKRYLIPYIKAALNKTPTLQLYASPWTPPAWMKANGRYSCKGTEKTGHLIWDDKTQTSYANYFVKFVKAYGKQGIHIKGIHLQNEPAACQIYPSSLWTGKEMRDFLKNYMLPTFKKSHLNTELWLGTINYGDYEAYAKPTFTDPELKKDLAGIGYQWDGKYAIQETHKRLPDVKIMQTESECGDGSNDIVAGLYTFSLLKTYFDGGASSYFYWNMVLDSTGNSTWGWRQNSMVSVDRMNGTGIHYNFDYYVMKHFSHFIQPGAHLVKTSYQEDLLTFKNPNGEYVVVVANPSYSPRHLKIRLNKKMLTATLPMMTVHSFVIKP